LLLVQQAAIWLVAFVDAVCYALACLLYETWFACKSQLVSVTVQVVRAVVVELMSDSFLQQTMAESESMEVMRTKPQRKHRHARLGYNTAWILNKGVRESECSKAASAAPLAWVTQ